MRPPTTRRQRLSVDALEAGVAAGDPALLARAITLIESNRPADRPLADDLLTRLLPRTGEAIRVGITGVPGVGKSTFIEALGTRLSAAGHRLAVLAVDPSSTRTGGSILGDKTRMESLARDPGAFIRPSPTGGALGGVASRTREALLLCEAAGYDVVLVETVGVGQSETQVAQMTDTFLALMLAGAGDQLQGIKRGLMELADLVVVNKADGENRVPAERAAGQLRQALHLLTPAVEGWRPPVLLTSALEGAGVDAVWRQVQAHRAHLQRTDAFARQRAGQRRQWLWSLVDAHQRRAVRAHPDAPAIEAAVVAGTLPATVGAKRLV